MDEVKKIYSKSRALIAEIPLNENGVFKEYYESGKLKSMQRFLARENSILKRYDENGNHIDRWQKNIAIAIYLSMLSVYFIDNSFLLISAIISSVMKRRNSLQNNNLYESHFDFQALVLWGGFSVSFFLAMSLSYVDISNFVMMALLIIQLAIFLFGIKGFINLLDDKEMSYIFNKEAQISEYNNDMARIRIGEKYGFINKNGTLVIPLLYDYASDFNDSGLAKVKQNGKEFYINSQGDKINFE